MSERVTDVTWCADEIRRLAWELGNEVDGYLASSVDREQIMSTSDALRQRLVDVTRITAALEKEDERLQELDRKMWARTRKTYVRTKVRVVKEVAAMR